MNTQPQLNRIAAEWLAARRVIYGALVEWGASANEAEARAEAIIARLAAHDPPILLEMQEAEGVVCHVCSERSPDCSDCGGVPVCRQCSRELEAVT
jgi:hypothetical protein